MSLRDLIGEEKWKILSRRYEHLNELLYLVVCETCGEAFFKEKLSKVQEMMTKGEWDPYQPQLWYVTAARHWIKGKYHAIRTYVVDGTGDRSLIKDLSAEWTSQAKVQAKTVKGSIDKAMLKELDDLEQQIKQR